MGIEETGYYSYLHFLLFLFSPSILWQLVLCLHSYTSRSIAVVGCMAVLLQHKGNTMCMRINAASYLRKLLVYCTTTNDNIPERGRLIRTYMRYIYASSIPNILRRLTVMLRMTAQSSRYGYSNKQKHIFHIPSYTLSEYS